MSRHCREAAIRVCRDAQLNGFLSVVCAAIWRSATTCAVLRPVASASMQADSEPVDSARVQQPSWGAPGTSSGVQAASHPGRQADTAHDGTAAQWLPQRSPSGHAWGVQPVHAREQAHCPARAPSSAPPLVYQHEHPWVRGGAVPGAARGYAALPQTSGPPPDADSGQAGPDAEGAPRKRRRGRPRLYDDGDTGRRSETAHAAETTSSSDSTSVLDIQSDSEAVHSFEWLSAFREICERYVAKFGELPPPTASFGRKPVGRWLDACVREYKQATWPARRRLYEQTLGPLLQDALSAHSTSFKKCLEASAQYFAEHGRLPHNQVTVADPLRPERRLLLGYWMANRRKDFRDGALSEEHIALMDEKLPGWRPQFKSREEQWQARLVAFEAFYKAFGRLPARRDGEGRVQDALFSGLSLYRWVSGQRDGLRKRRLVRQQIEALDNVTPAWRPPGLKDVPIEKLQYVSSPRRAQEKEAFMQTLAAIARFVEQHGHLPRSVCHLRDEQATALAKWLDARRCDFTRNKLAAWRIKLLDEKAPGWSQPCAQFQRSWEHKFAVLKRFVQQNQRGPRSGETLEGIRLDTWVHSQRLRHRYGLLSKEREAALRREFSFVLGPQEGDGGHLPPLNTHEKLELERD